MFSTMLGSAAIKRSSVTARRFWTSHLFFYESCARQTTTEILPTSCQRERNQFCIQSSSCEMPLMECGHPNFMTTR